MEFDSFFLEVKTTQFQRREEMSWNVVLTVQVYIPIGYFKKSDYLQRTNK